MPPFGGGVGFAGVAGVAGFVWPVGGLPVVPAAGGVAVPAFVPPGVAAAGADASVVPAGVEAGVLPSSDFFSYFSYRVTIP